MIRVWVAQSGPPVPASLISFTADANLALFEGAGAATLHTLPFSFNPGNTTETQGIGVCSAELFVLCRHVLDHFRGQYVLKLPPRYRAPFVPIITDRLSSITIALNNSTLTSVDQNFDPTPDRNTILALPA